MHLNSCFCHALSYFVVFDALTLATRTVIIKAPQGLPTQSHYTSISGQSGTSHLPASLGKNSFLNNPSIPETSATHSSEPDISCQSSSRPGPSTPPKSPGGTRTHVPNPSAAKEDLAQVNNNDCETVSSSVAAPILSPAPRQFPRQLDTPQNNTAIPSAGQKLMPLTLHRAQPEQHLAAFGFLLPRALTTTPDTPAPTPNLWPLSKDLYTTGTAQGHPIRPHSNSVSLQNEVSNLPASLGKDPFRTNLNSPSIPKTLSTSDSGFILSRQTSSKPRPSTSPEASRETRTHVRNLSAVKVDFAQANAIDRETASLSDWLPIRSPAPRQFPRQLDTPQNNVKRWNTTEEQHTKAHGFFLPRALATTPSTPAPTLSRDAFTIGVTQEHSIKPYNSASLHNSPPSLGWNPFGTKLNDRSIPETLSTAHSELVFNPQISSNTWPSTLPKASGEIRTHVRSPSAVKVDLAQTNAIDHETASLSDSLPIRSPAPRQFPRQFPRQLDTPQNNTAIPSTSQNAIKIHPTFNTFTTAFKSNSPNSREDQHLKAHGFFPPRALAITPSTLAPTSNPWPLSRDAFTTGFTQGHPIKPYTTSDSLHNSLPWLGKSPFGTELKNPSIPETFVTGSLVSPPVPRQSPRRFPRQFPRQFPDQQWQ